MLCGVIGRKRRRELEAALARGADPSASRELSSVTKDLESPETRQGIAASIMNLIDAADEPPSTWRAYGIDPPLRADAVRAAREALVSLATALRADERPAARGVAIASCLVHDRSSPVYSRVATDRVDVWADNAREAMSAGEMGAAGFEPATSRV
jgi:hypothetical protein